MKQAQEHKIPKTTEQILKQERPVVIGIFAIRDFKKDKPVINQLFHLLLTQNLVGSGYLAHNLELDLVGHGANKDDAFENLILLTTGQIDIMRKENRLGELCMFPSQTAYLAIMSNKLFEWSTGSPQVEKIPQQMKDEVRGHLLKDPQLV